MFERTFSFWRRLVGKSPPNPAVGAPSERRLWVRYPAELKTSVHLNGKAEAARLEVVVRDISLGGVNLIVDRPLVPGVILSVELPQSAAGDSHEVLACVVRTVEEGPGQWSLGCVFSRELTDSDLAGFGAKRVRTDPQDQRIWMRFPCNLRATLQIVDVPDTPPCEVQVINVSPSGVGLLVHGPIEAGTLLAVELINEQGIAKSILACVVHVTGHANGAWSLGCNFIRQMQEHEWAGLVQPTALAK